MLPNSKSLSITQVQLKAFRCFTDVTLCLNAPLLLIEGNNGSGKTSLLEALYYSCYLHSFRASTPKEMIHDGDNNFFIKIHLESKGNSHADTHVLQVGFSREKRIVKIDQKNVTLHKELLSTYRIMSITEDDLELITGSPSIRRTFMDQALAFIDTTYLEQLKKFRHILEQRNALLERHPINQELYTIMTEQLWTITSYLQKQRIALIDQLQSRCQLLVEQFLGTYNLITLAYHPKMNGFNDFNSFIEHAGNLSGQEQRYGRSLFGAHLDDLSISFYAKKSKIFASRGQQKLLVILLKIAQLQMVLERFPGAILMLDDFMTDFDSERMGRLLDMFTNLDAQLIFTMPSQDSFLKSELLRRKALHILFPG
jgi:DNA replication and repair protein RecF